MSITDHVILSKEKGVSRLYQGIEIGIKFGYNFCNSSRVSICFCFVLLAFCWYKQRSHSQRESVFFPLKFYIELYSIVIKFLRKRPIIHWNLCLRFIQVTGYLTDLFKYVHVGAMCVYLYHIILQVVPLLAFFPSDGVEYTCSYYPQVTNIQKVFYVRASSWGSLSEHFLQSSHMMTRNLMSCLHRHMLVLNLKVSLHDW